MRVLNRPRAALAVVALAAAACKKAPPLATPAPPAAPAAVAVASLDLGKAIGAEKRVMTPLTSFGPRDTIYASVATTGSTTGATLTAKWTFQTGQTVDSTTTSIAPSGPSVTEFHVMKQTAWPAGKYKVAVHLNGAATLEKEFEVKK